MDQIGELYHQYAEQLIAWYDGLEPLYQYGLFFLLIIGGLFVAAYVMLSRITR